MTTRKESSPSGTNKTDTVTEEDSILSQSLIRLVADRALPSPRSETTRAILQTAAKSVAERRCATSTLRHSYRMARRARFLTAAAVLLACLGIWRGVDILRAPRVHERLAGVPSDTAKAKTTCTDEVDRRLATAWSSVSRIGLSGGSEAAQATIDRWMTQVGNRVASLREDEWGAAKEVATPEPTATPALESTVPPCRLLNDATCVKEA